MPHISSARWPRRWASATKRESCTGVFGAAVMLRVLEVVVIVLLAVDWVNFCAKSYVHFVMGGRRVHRPAIVHYQRTR